MDNLCNILDCFPSNIKDVIENVIKDIIGVVKIRVMPLEEIRIRVDKPIILKCNDKEHISTYIPNSEDILDIMQKICDNSIYSFQKQIVNGFITIKGGHRVGISGSVVIKDDKVINISHISSLNFRIAKEIIGISNSLLKDIINKDENSIYNTLIISPPGCGKTTLLRDIIRNLSSGIKEYEFKGINIGVVDTRGEIGAMYNGIIQNDLGIRTDLLDGIEKPEGLMMLIRTMSPKVVAADEIGSRKDVDAIKYAMCCGINGIFTAHGSSIEDIRLNLELKDLIDNGYFKRLVFLSLKDKSISKIVYLD